VRTPPPAPLSPALALAFLLALAAPAAPVRAASPSQVQAVAARLRPTSCTPNYSAADCPTEEARQFRRRIAELLDRGLTPDQVVRRFVHEYGPQVLFVPPSRGAAALVWTLPFAGVVLGAAIWWRFVRARRPSPGAAPPSAASEPPDPPVIDPDLDDYL
jgi:cytochrome c-type biogenesis protein CcmH/NrfF